MYFPPGLSYAIQALVLLGEEGPYLRVRELADQAQVPRAFLAKLMQKLAKGGLVEGHRGPTGGYRLAHPPAQLTIRRLAQVLEENLGLPECILSHRPCGERPCVMHQVWGRLRPELEGDLLDLSLAEIQAGGVFPPPKGQELRRA